MQSYLQYHRFNKHVSAQYERDQEKALALKQHSDCTITSKPRQEDDNDTRDLEKAEGSIADDGSQPETHSITSPPQSELQTPTLDRQSDYSMSRVQTAVTRQSHGTNIGRALTGIEVRHRTTREGGNKSKVFVVGYEGEYDELNPHNWGWGVRFGATQVL